MKMLSDIPFPPILDTSSGDIIRDFFNPSLVASVSYDRGVGFFSASWLRLAAKGMTEFAANSGRARWVTSPILSETDWEAMQEGSYARQNDILKQALEVSIADLKKTLEQDTLSALAWLVADGILDFKLALPRNKLDQGEFHDKFGIFTDSEGNQVSFNGSYNDSVQGTRNYESIKIFCSWHPVLDLLVKADNERFERLWNNKDPNVQVFDLPEAARASIVRLRSYDRPYVRDGTRIAYGPYKMEWRKTFLKRLLTIQNEIRKTGPDPSVRLISFEEMEYIRDFWREEEWTDSLPEIYRRTVKDDHVWLHDDGVKFSQEDFQLLKQFCEEEGVKGLPITSASRFPA